MLRAVRFAARLGFAIEPETMAEMRGLAPRLSLISPERIAMELAGILSPVTREAGWKLLSETNLCRHLVPSWKPDHEEQSRISARMAGLPAHPVDFALTLAALWTDHTPAAARTYARELRCSNRDARAVFWLITKLTDLRHPEKLSLAAIKRMRGDADWPLLSPLAHAAIAADGADPEPVNRVLTRTATIPAERIAPPPLLTGDDIQALGVPAGRALGELVDRLYTAQLDEEITDRVQAEEMLRRWMTQGPKRDG